MVPTAEVPSWAILALQLEVDGSLAATYWDPRASTWTFGAAVALVGGPQAPTFSVIAVNNDCKFYGIVGGTILEYLIDSSNPTRFVFTTSIPLLNDTVSAFRA